jgi:hypothetical protein
MFRSLDEEIEEREGGRPKTSLRAVRYLLLLLLTTVLFGGLYLGIRFVD